MVQHLPALQIAVPLIAAPVCALLVQSRLAGLFATAAAWLTFAIAIALFLNVLGLGFVWYEMGGWAPPLGIGLVVDPMSALLLVLVSGMAAIIMPAVPLGIGVEVAPRAQRLFYTLALLALTGMLGIVVTGDVFNLYVFLEISSLASYALVATANDRRASKAAFSYLALGTVGATFILIGIGLIYMVTGTLNMSDLAVRLPALWHLAPVQASLAFILVGAGIKFALFPAHVWMPNAYTYAPSLVSAFFGATATKVGAYILIRFIYNVFGAEFAFVDMRIGWVLIPLGIAGAFVGSLVAIWQNDLRRMLAYSSVAQVGYIAAAIGYGNQDGLVAAIVHAFNHGLMKGALFLVMACVIMRLGNANLETFRGLGRRMPITMACFVVAGLSMIGVPFTVGFVSKWYLIAGALRADLWPVAVLIVLSSLLAIIYIWRVVEVAYFQPPPEGAGRSEAPAMLLGTTVLLTVLCVVFGIATRFTVNVADVAAVMLGAPL
ncbi:MAG: monovalent cation/H+ antiporter subunit D family protein [Rhodospirillales bacterium]|nr:monovalent cation/H+ antiporter subunit D family protein [Rhodospirillales bacterium]